MYKTTLTRSNYGSSLTRFVHMDLSIQHIGHWHYLINMNIYILHLMINSLILFKYNRCIHVYKLSIKMYPHMNEYLFAFLLKIPKPQFTVLEDILNNLCMYM